MESTQIRLSQQPFFPMQLFFLIIFLAFSHSIQAQVWDTAWSFDGGGQMGESLGFSVAGGADVDLDGFDDLILGAPNAMNNGVFSSGAVYVRSGRDGSLLHEFRGLDFPPAVYGGAFGSAVTWIDDLDGDTIPDIVIGAKNKENPAYGDGEVVVYSGANGAVIHNLIRSSIYLRGFGAVVAPAGDFDGDMVMDILVGAPSTYISGLGASTGAFLVYSGATGAELLRVDGHQGASSFGSSVAHVGDVNADGTPDYIVGAYGSDVGFTTNVGEAYLVSGATGNTLYQYTGTVQNHRLGYAVAGGSDLNNDGIGDFLISCSGQAPYGVAYAYSGASGSLLFQVDGEASSGFGEALCMPGDLSNDGNPDIVVGAPYFSHLGSMFAYEGSVYLYSGVNGALLERIDGSSLGQQLGYSIATAGDITLSGTPSIIVGGGAYSSAGVIAAGKVEVFFDTSLPSSSDDDGDALRYFREIALSTNPLDQDTDDDGLSDGEEYFANGANMVEPTDPTVVDSDGDGLQDGTELGLASIVWTGSPPTILGTDPLVFRADLDPSSLTDPMNPDSDDGGVVDGGEDIDSNGRVDVYETDPNQASDDRVIAGFSSNMPTISNGQAQVTTLTLDFGSNYPGHHYRILGSLQGSAPGFVYQGVNVPLVFDSLTMMLASGPSPIMLVNFAGTLDTQGYALGYIATRPGEVTSFVGQSIWFAAVSLDPISGVLSNATVAISLDIIP